MAQFDQRNQRVQRDQHNAGRDIHHGPAQVANVDAMYGNQETLDTDTGGLGEKAGEIGKKIIGRKIGKKLG